ncbi:MAG: BamA/TamA family outer membrane protein, partial [Myxococcota bacterium]
DSAAPAADDTGPDSAASPDPGPEPSAAADGSEPAAGAEPAAPAEETLPRPETPDAEFDAAPLPTEAGGVAVPRDRSNQRWRAVPRTILYPFRGLWYVAWGVPRLGMWAYNRYQLEDRFRQIFFNDTETVGVYPVAFVEAGFGLNAGARIIVRDIFAEDFRFRVRASYGGRFRQYYGVKLESGELFGDRLELELLGEYQIFPKSRFAGIGNGDLQDYMAGAPLIDALNDETAIATRFRHDDYRVELATLAHINDELSLRLSGSYKNREFDAEADPVDDEQLVAVYDTDSLLGFEDGLSNFYAELELIYDSRRVTEFYLPPDAPSTGWRVSAFAGYQTGFGDDPSGHGRWGLDAQRYFDLYRGDRVLVLRAYIEGVTADVDEIPFVDLPRLGGPLFLRGYDRDRFRDRYVTLGTIEYNYPIERNVGGYLFVDAGRVWRELDDIDGDDWRVGFGVGMQAHTTESFLTRVFLASSIDGGLIFNLSFDPVFDARSREESP